MVDRGGILKINYQENVSKIEKILCKCSGMNKASREKFSDFLFSVFY